MNEKSKDIPYGKGNPLWETNNSAIQKLNFNPELDSDVFYNSILEIGRLSVESHGFSNTQKEEIHQNLKQNGVLFYDKNYLDQHEDITDPVSESDFDFVRSEIEHDSRLQMEAIGSFFKIVNYSNDTEKINELVSVFNKAIDFEFEKLENRNFRDMFKKSVIEKISFQQNCNNFLNYYNTVFENREKTWQILVDKKILDKRKNINLFDCPKEEFFNIEGCDNFLIYPFFEKINKEPSLEQVFKVVQEVMILGGQMACTNYQKEQENSDQRF